MFDAKQEAKTIVGEREFYIFDFGTTGMEFYTTHFRRVSESVFTGSLVTWTPLPISRQGARLVQSSATKLRVKLPMTQAFISSLASGVVDRVKVTIIRGFGDDYANDYRNPWFVGFVKDIACSTTEMTANIESVESLFDDLFPRVIHQAGCNNDLYGPTCAVNPALHTFSRVVTTLAHGGRLVQFDGAIMTNDTVSTGWARKAGSSWRNISQQAGNQIVLSLPIQGLVVGDTIEMRRGCFKRIAEDCVGVFNNKHRNVSMPLIPQTNPVIDGF